MRYSSEDAEPLIMGRSGNKFSDKRCGRGVLVALVITFSLLAAAFLGCFLYYATMYVDATKGKPDWLQDPVSPQLLETFLYNGVTSDATVCSLIGAYVINTLNGSAMDAAVSTVLCVGVANSHSAGIGGGSFLMYYEKKSKRVTTFDYRETAPANASVNMYNALPKNASSTGGLAIAVPGEVSGLALAHARFGRLPWAAVVAPVSELLRNGQRVTQPLAEAIASTYESVPEHGPYAELKRWMVNPATGTPYFAGDVLKDAKLADTMDRIAIDPHGFYNGSLAEDIAAEMAAAGAIVSLRDLQAYRTSVPDPIAVDLRRSRLRVHSMPPPCSGPVLGFMLNVLDGYNDQGPGLKDRLGTYATFLHRMIETFKFGYAKRSALGDAAFVNVTDLLANLTSAEYADEIRARITDDATHDVPYYGPSFEWRPDRGTTHVSLVDSEGNAVTVTSTINGYFGSFIKGPKTGILYNNEMDDFSVPNRTNDYNLPPSEANFIAPGKRPMSSMSPVFVTDLDDELVYINGGAGGSLITTAVAATLARQIYLNETVKEATDAFRLHHQLVPNEIMYNESPSVAQRTMLAALAGKGHTSNRTGSHSVIEGMHRLADGNWQSSGDFRKPSKPAGY